MCQILQISLEDLDGLLMSLPILDSLRVEQGAFVVGFVPHDLVSREEKELVVIDAASAEGRRIAERVGEIATLLGLGSISSLVHGGGAAFTFHGASGGGAGGAGGVASLSDAGLAAQGTLTVLDALRDIAGTAQIVFLRAHRVAA